MPPASWYNEDAEDCIRPFVVHGGLVYQEVHPSPATKEPHSPGRLVSKEGGYESSP